MYATCTQYVHNIYTTCTQHVNEMYTKCTQHIHNMYTTCTGKQHVHNMYTCTIQTCKQHVHNMYTTYTQHVHKMYTTPSPGLRDRNDPFTLPHDRFYFVLWDSRDGGKSSPQLGSTCPLQLLQPSRNFCLPMELIS